MKNNEDENLTESHSHIEHSNPEERYEERKSLESELKINNKEKEHGSRSIY